MKLPQCPSLAWKIGRLAWSQQFVHHTMNPRYERGTLFCLDGTFEHIGFGFMWKVENQEVPRG